MATWGDYTLRDLIDKITGRISELRNESPKPEILLEPVDTSGATVPLGLSRYGAIIRLFKKTEDDYTPVSGSTFNTANTTSLTINASLASIAQTGIYRFAINYYGTNVTLYSKDFTVTRTAAQTQALKQDLGTAEKSDVVEPVADTMDVEPVKETTTTIKGK